jgi:hypothetical protein
MSGKDERKFSKIPRCTRCKEESDIEIRYPNLDTAGWILSEADRRRYGVVVILNEGFHSYLGGISANCVGCGYLNVEVADKAVEFFKNEVQARRYVTWSAWMEMGD